MEWSSDGTMPILCTGTDACAAWESLGLWLGVAETGERLLGGLGEVGGRGEGEG